MANVFISYSSSDKDFASRLAGDLEILGHNIWLDEWQIKVGESIPTKIQEGIEKAKYVIVILSPSSIESGWVEKEWQTAYWAEIENKSIVVLPVLYIDCNIPALLRPKKYADFRGKYEIGFAKLSQAIIPAEIKDLGIDEASGDKDDAALLNLLSDIQGNNKPLSQCLATAISIARKYGNCELEEFCSLELTGYDESEPEKLPNYRIIPAFVTMAGEINPMHFGWAGNINNMFAYIKRNPDVFKLTNLALSMPINSLEQIKEKDDQEYFFHLTLNAKEAFPGFPDDNVIAHCYAEMSRYSSVMSSIGTELTKRLLNLLPKTP